MLRIAQELRMIVSAKEDSSVIRSGSLLAFLRHIADQVKVEHALGTPSLHAFRYLRSKLLVQVECLRRQLFRSVRLREYFHRRLCRNQIVAEFALQVAP